MLVEVRNQLTALLDQHHVVAVTRELCGQGRADQTTTDDDYTHGVTPAFVEC